MINYNVIVRCLTEWTSGNPHMCMDQSTINEGIGGVTMGHDRLGTPGLVNVRQRHIQGTSGAYTNAGVNPFAQGQGFGKIPQTATKPPGFSEVAGYLSTTRRYQVNFALGMFTQEKLIPTKFMASQLAIEITLEQTGYCVFTPYGGSQHDALTPSYLVSEVNLIPEVLEFDASYGKCNINIRCNVSSGIATGWCTNQVFFMAYIYLFICKFSECKLADSGKI